MIDVHHLSKSFGDFSVLKNVDVKIKQGEVVVILGPSGSGKTTFLRSINALEIPEKGTLSIDDFLIDFGQNPQKKDLVELRKKTAMVFQNFNLFPHLTALENITEGLIIVKKISKKKAEEIGLGLLKKVGLENKHKAYPAMLSGGQQQRVAIARSLAMDPQVMLFDEPTSALDVEMVDGILKLMQQLAGEGMTMVVVTHEISFAQNAADRILFIDEGVILDDISASDLHNGGHSKRLTEFLRLIEHR